MMFNIRQDKLPSVSRYKYRLNSFNGIDAEKEENLLEPNVATYGYNISFQDGALKNSIGINEAKIKLTPDLDQYSNIPHYYTNGIKKMHIFNNESDVHYPARTTKLFISTLSGKVLLTTLESATWVSTDIQSTEKEVQFINWYLNDKMVLLIYLKEGGMYQYDDSGSFKYFKDTPPLTSVCSHYERLFGTNGKDTIYFSNDLDPTDFTASEFGGGQIKMVDEEGGRILKLISFNDYIYVFREHSIYRLTAFTDPSDFRLSKVYETDQLIIKDTVTRGDDRIFFLADKSLYTFNGYTALRKEKKVTELIDKYKNATASFYKNKYYLSVYLKKHGDVVGDEELDSTSCNNGMIIFDVSSNNVEIFRGTDVYSLVPVVNRDFDILLCNFRNFRMHTIGMIDDSGTLFNKPLEKLWVGPKTQFSSLENIKRLRKASVLTKYPIKIKVSTENSSREKTVYGGELRSLVTFNEVGEYVQLEIKSDEALFYVKAMLLELDFLRRYYAN